jgi:sodium-coupled monocarboxylate transporter 8/12
MTQLGTLDWVVLVSYLALVVGIGVFASRNNKNSTDLLLAGRSANWLAVAASMYASFFSSISFLAMPAETFRHNWQYALGMLTMPLAAFVAGYLFVEFFYRLRIFTVFQYAQMRFNDSVRILLAVLFVVGKSFHAGLVVYGGSLALSIATGLPIVPVTLAVGAMAVIYTFAGGLKAVIWTDVVQLLVLSSSIVAILVYALNGLDGGWGDLARIGAAHHKFSVLDAKSSFDVTARLTTPGVLLGAFAAWLSQKGADQVNAQLYLAGRSAAQARRSLMLAPVISIIIGGLLYTIGTAFWVYYQQHPDANVTRFVATNQHDKILPYFVMNVLPIGMRGLVVAGLFAAAVSTIVALLNALATTSLVDFYRNWIDPQPGAEKEVAIARIFILAWGVVITTTAIWVIPFLGESLVDKSNRIIGFAGGPVLGVFLLGMFSRRASSTGAILGACGSFLLLVAMFLLGKEYPRFNVSFMLYAAIGIVTTIVFGFISSLAFPQGDKSRANGLLWRDVVWQAWQREDAAQPSSTEPAQQFLD